MSDLGWYHLSVTTAVVLAQPSPAAGQNDFVLSLFPEFKLSFSVSGKDDADIEVPVAQQ